MDNNERVNPSDDAVREGFDQTNDLAGDQLGESDETADGALSSAADRAGDDDSLIGGGDDGGGDYRDDLPGSPGRGGSGGI